MKIRQAKKIVRQWWWFRRDVYKKSTLRAAFIKKYKPLQSEGWLSGAAIPVGSVVVAEGYVVKRT